MEEQYINLHPNNWFLLQQTNKTKLQPFSLESFKIEIVKQINDPNKLEFIESAFIKKYPKCKIEDIDFYLDETKFEKMINLIEDEGRHPMITFHGTSYASVKSILTSGYIIPESRNGVKNAVKIKNGSMYGCGVYTSPFFDKAIYYAVPENASHVYMIVNFLIIGKTRLIPPNGNNMYNVKPHNNQYSDGVCTNIVFGLEQIISADNNKVIPIAVLKIKIK